jgi:electron transfer flavoprotein alpha subunit
VSDTWVVVDGQDEVGAALDALGAAGGAVTALVVGPQDLAEQVGRGVADVQWIDAGDTPTEAWADAAAGLGAAAAPAIVVGATTPGGRAILGAVATRMSAPLVSNVVAIRRHDDGVEADRLDLAGRITETVRTPTSVCLLVSASDTPAPTRDDTAPVTPVRAMPAAVARLKVEPAPGATSRITTAERVVAVGRGLGSKEALGMVEQLARALDAEIGCSMPVAEDLGWVPPERYVGLSGQHISPKLYLALGISGAPQHIAGIRNARTIVAVDIDPHAPFFKTADYGIVGDLHEVVPELIRALDET